MKHFYSQEEACDKLNLSPEGLKLKVRDGLLAEFRDGGRTIYRIPRNPDGSNGQCKMFVKRNSDEVDT